MNLSAPIYRLKRQAKQLARETSRPMNETLDQIASDEGFRSWSHLSSVASQQPVAKRLLNGFQPRELILIAGRPGQGKTTLALTILAEAVLRHRRAWFFTLEYTEAEAWRRLEGEGYSQSRLRPYLNIDASDDLSAKTMVDHMRPNVEEKPWLAVIDYLQIMDQNRQHPPLQQQVDMLKDFAREAGGTILLLSQVDRQFTETDRQIPTRSDIRLPNPLDLSIFDRFYALHDGEISLNTRD